MALTSTASPRGKPEIVGSNLDTLVNIGLDEKLPTDYRLAQQVWPRHANISDRRKARGVVTLQTRESGCPLSTSTPPAAVFSSLLVGERHPPFRLPQEHRLFERLREMVTKGELPQSLGQKGLSLWWQLPLFLRRQHPPRPA